MEPVVRIILVGIILPSVVSNFAGPHNRQYGLSKPNMISSAEHKMDPVLVLKVNTNWFKITPSAESKMDSQLVVVHTQH